MKIEIELKTEIASKQAAPWCTGNWLQTHVGAVGCLNVANAFCCFLDLTILMLNRFVGYLVFVCIVILSLKPK